MINRADVITPLVRHVLRPKPATLFRYYMSTIEGCSVIIERTKNIVISLNCARRTC